MRTEYNTAATKVEPDPRPNTNSSRLRMALITCPECGKQVSTEAKVCPACGYPVAERADSDAAALPPAASASAADAFNAQAVLLEVRPSWWNFGWHLLFVWLLVPLFIALYRRHSFVMRIYSDRVSVEEGFWSKESSEFFIKDIRSIDVRQGIWGRLVGIGDVTISTAATVDAAEEARGVPQPKRIKELLIAQRQQSTT
jgi:membrane protein YdbS with pleckstrin-like domain